MKVVSDNTTTVSYINHMGGTRSEGCNAIAHDIWSWCEERDLWLLAAHIPGVQNVQADKESRCFTENTEWELNNELFRQITHKWGYPEVDLFASRLNAKVSNYVSWHPDPGSMFVNAFSIDWSSFKLCYLFPPFRLLPKCLRIIRLEGVKAIAIVPNWMAQPWYPVFQKMAREKITFPSGKNNLLSSQHVEGKSLDSVQLIAGLCF